MEKKKERVRERKETGMPTVNNKERKTSNEDRKKLTNLPNYNYLF